jgi:hypothetical protein
MADLLLESGDEERWLERKGDRRAGQAYRQP